MPEKGSESRIQAALERLRGLEQQVNRIPPQHRRPISQAVAGLIETLSMGSARAARSPASPTDQRESSPSDQPSAVPRSDDRTRPDADESILEAVMENTHAMLVYLDTQFNFVRVNSAYAKGSGYRKEDLIGRNHFELFPHAENQAIFEHVRDTGEPVAFTAKPFDHPMQRERGTTYWDWTLVPVKDRAGQVQGLVFSLLDVTDLQRAEQAVHAERDNLIQILDSMEDMVYIVDSNFKVQYANPAFEREFGPPEGRRCYAYIEDRTEACPWCKNDEVFAGHTVRWEKSCPRTGKTYDLIETPIRSPVTTPWKMVIFRDITDRARATGELKRARDALEHANRRIGNILGSIVEGYFEMDRDWRIAEINEQCAAMLGRPREQLIGQVMWEMFPQAKNTEFYRQYQRALRDGVAVHFEAASAIVPKWLETHVYPTKQGLAIYVHDITDRKRAEESVREALSQSRQRQAEIAALLDSSRAILEHREFQDAARSIFDSCRTLIGATAGYVALLSRDGSENEVLFLESGGMPCTVNRDLPMPIRGLRESAYRTAKAVYENAFASSEWVQFLPEGHLRLDNVLFAPLVLGEKAVGLLGLANKPGGFNDDDARIATAFGDLAAIALQNSRSLESLQDNEERFRSVAQTANDAVITIDGRSHVTFWNNGAERLFGYPAEEMVGKPLTVVMPERLRKAHTRAVERLLAGGEPKILGQTVELAGLTKSGRQVPLELSLAAWSTRDGRFYTGIARDISERKRAKEELEKERDFTTAVLKTAGALVVVLDVHGRIVQFNRACERATGYTADEVRGKPFWDLFLIPEEVDDVKVVFKSLRAGQFPSEHENYWKARDGTLRWIAWSNTCLLNAEGAVEYVIGTGVDITERKQAEEALRRSREDLTRAQAVAHSGNWRLNVRKNELLWSDETHRIFGIPRGMSLTYETFLAAVHPEDREYVDERWQAALHGERYDIEHRIVVDGAIKWVREKAELEFDDRGTLLGGFGTVQDITERKRAEQRLEILSQTSGRLLASDSPQQIVNTLLERVLVYLDCHVFFNYLVEPSGERLSLNAYAGIPDETARTIKVLEFGQAVCGTVARDGRPIIAENIQDSCDPRADLVRSFGIRAYACHPLLAGGRVIGTLSFGTRSRTNFDDDELNLMKTVTDQVALAMERKQAEEALRESRQQLAIRNEIAEVFLTTPDDEVYNKALPVVLQALESEYGLFGYIDEDGALVCPSITREIWQACQMDDKTVVFPREKWGGIWGRALTTGKTVRSNQSLQVPQGHIPLTRAMAVPIASGEQVIGLFVVANKAHDYGDKDQALLEMIAGHVAPILNARLHSDRESQARERAEDVLRNLRRRFRAEQSFAGIVGADPKMLDLFDTIRELAEVDVPVLIQGESGTGKELVAAAIHNEGHRSDGPFVAVNCGALPETLLESELFGHVRGAFTGAVRDKKGRFALADGGTIFLDEIAELSPPLQVKLLRVLQEGSFEPVGSEKTRRVNVRVISATNRDLEQRIAAGRFRGDLFYRLCVIPLHIPPLRERSSDIPLLAQHILEQARKQRGGGEVHLSQEVLDAFMEYGWPGNVRELQNAISFGLVKCKSGTLEIRHIPHALWPKHPASKATPGKRPGRRRKLDIDSVKNALREAGGNRSQAADRLGVNRITLYRFLKREGIS